MCVTQVWGAVTPLNLPKSWGATDGKSAYTEALGCTLSGLGSDYSSAPKLKFDNQGDYMIIQVADAPASISFNIKGNSVSGTYSFKVQESANGSSYTDALNITSVSGSSAEKSADLQSTTRYIKLIYTTKANGNMGVGGISITKAAASVPYTVTFNAGSNGTCSTSNLIEASAGAGVTLPSVTANTGYRFVGWSTSSTPTSANAGEAGDTYKPSANTTLYAYYIQTHTVNWYVNGSATPVTVDHGADLAIPGDIDTDIDCGGKVFVGWCTTASYSNPTTAPTGMFTAASGTVNADANYYAVFANADGEETTETFGWEEATTPSNWTIGGTITRTEANASYSANSGSYYGLTNSNSSVQFKNKVNVKSFSYNCVRRTTNTNTSIKIETSSNGTIWTEALSTTWNTFNSDGKTYKKIEKTWDEPVECYVRVNLVTAAYRQLDDISITYDNVTYSNYATTCGPAGPCATPTFSQEGGSYCGTQSVTISCSTGGASIYYTTDGTTPTSSSTLYSSAISVSADMTIKAIAVKDGLIDSEVATAAYSITDLRDTFIDNLHENATQYGDCDNYTVPSLSDETPASACEGEHYHFVGWSSAQLYTGQHATEPAGLLKAGSHHNADGSTYYAVWAKEQH